MFRRAFFFLILALSFALAAARKAPAGKARSLLRELSQVNSPFNNPLGTLVEAAQRTGQGLTDTAKDLKGETAAKDRKDKEEAERKLKELEKERQRKIMEEEKEKEEAKKKEKKRKAEEEAEKAARAEAERVAAEKAKEERACSIFAPCNRAAGYVCKDRNDGTICNIGIGACFCTNS